MDLVLKKNTGAVRFRSGQPAEREQTACCHNSIRRDQKRLLGMTFGTVELRPLTREIRTSARIVPDETRLYRVTTKIDGYVDELFVNVTGQEVKKGQPLLSVYSPELVSSQEEFSRPLPQHGTSSAQLP